MPSALFQAQMTAFYAHLFNSTMCHDSGLKPAIEIHSRKSQTQRTRCSEQFRSSRSAVMFSSDVSARGVDYPDVTHVLQFGLPPSTDQYIHRLGRTGRNPSRSCSFLMLIETSAAPEQSLLLLVDVWL